MSELLLPIGGGGGTSSDELTATKAQVLAGYTAVTKDSNDESIVGTMPDNNSTTSNGTVPGINDSYPNVPTREADNLQYNVSTDSIARISMCPPKGYYSGGGGSYINRPASDFGNATANRVVEGNTFTSSAGIKVSGTIVDRGLSQYGGFGEGTDYYAINSMPEGWYHSDGNDWAPEARISKTMLRDRLGVNAANIRSGTSIAGVAGTLSVQSAISFSAAATSYNTIRISWNNPPKGPWQGVFIQMSTGGYPGTGGGSRVYTGSGYTNQSTAGAWNYVDITGLSADTTYYFTCTSYVDNLGWGTSYNVNAKTQRVQISNVLNSKILSDQTEFHFTYLSNYYYSAHQYIDKIDGNRIYTKSTTSYTSSRYEDRPSDVTITPFKPAITSTELSYLQLYTKMRIYEYRNDRWVKISGSTDIPITFRVQNYKYSSQDVSMLIIDMNLSNYSGSWFNGSRIIKYLEFY